MNNKTDNWIWLGCWAYGIGALLPFVTAVIYFREFCTLKEYDGLFFLLAGIPFSCFLFKKIEEKNPQLKKLNENSIIVMVLFLFIIAFVPALGLILITFLPVPEWMHISVGVLLILWSWTLIYRNHYWDR